MRVLLAALTLARLVAAPEIPVTDDAFEPPAPDTSLTPKPAEPPPSASIVGHVEDSASQVPIESALVVLSCTCLDEPAERFTNNRGVYLFAELPAGNYTVSVFSGNVEARRDVRLDPGAQERANFAIDTGAPTLVMLVDSEPGDSVTSCVYGPRRCTCRTRSLRAMQRAQERAERRARRRSLRR